LCVHFTDTHSLALYATGLHRPVVGKRFPPKR
jgi:hypothetical protein